MSTAPRFGVVVVNWNGAKDTVASLESLWAAAPPPQHVVVVDNGSTDGSIEQLRAWASARSSGTRAGGPPAQYAPRP